MHARGIWLVMMAVGFLGCKKSPLARLENVRDALASDEAARIAEAVDGLAPCDAPPVDGKRPCLNAIATTLGSKDGFLATVPNQASAGAAAVILVRDHHGDWIPEPGTWLASMRAAKGPGADALRLAVAREMALNAPKIAHKAVEESDARAMMAGIAAAIPGSCSTYADLGAGVDEKTLPPERTSDHSPCVQRDLGRVGGPGGTYGQGLWRAAMGASMLWKEEARILHDGAAHMDGKAKERLLAELAIVDDATAKMELKAVETPQNGAFYAIGMHDDAGVPLSAAPDAGANDAGARKLTAPSPRAPSAPR
jgi:hypothetical protein